MYIHSKVPEIAAFWEAVEDWGHTLNMPGDGAQTVKQASDFVARTLILVDAGLADTDIIKDCIDSLYAEKTLSKDKSAGEEVYAVFDAAIESLEAKLLENKPELKIDKVIEAEIEKATKLAENEKFMDATQILTSILLASRNKKFFAGDPELKATITAQRDSYKAEWFK